MSNSLFQLINSKKYKNLFFIVFISISLLAGYSINKTHLINIYKCYAMAFLYPGNILLHSPMKAFCNYTAANVSPQAFQHLPSEYPLLTLALFIPPFLISPLFYEIIFSLEMLSIVIFIFYYLQKIGKPQNAYIYMLYVVLGSLDTAVSRYDIAVGALTLLCVHTASTKKFMLAYLFLSLATLLKIFPILFLFPLFIYEQRTFSKHTFFRIRFKGIAFFISICLFVSTISFLISPTGTLSPLLYFQARPFEIESAPATVLLIASELSKTPLYIRTSYSSTNLYAASQYASGIPTSTENIISSLFLLFFFILLLLLYLLFSRKKATFPELCIALIFLTLSTGKVFSPQYLLWISPLIAYMYGSHPRWFLLWSTISLLTTLIYPLFWGEMTLPFLSDVQIVILLSLIRNMLLVIVTGAYSMRLARR